MVISAFDHLVANLASRFARMAEGIIQDVAQQIASYGNKDRLCAHFERDVRRIIGYYL